jgi:hypothetical protein
MTISHTTIILANFWTYELYVCTGQKNLKLRHQATKYTLFGFWLGSKNRPKYVGNI